eukprot:7306084-Prymnesium_polylepis.1
MQLDDGAPSGSTKPPLSSRDAELLLQYLTVPYLRIPLLLQFFADQQRLNALGSTRMQEVRRPPRACESPKAPGSAAQTWAAARNTPRATRRARASLSARARVRYAQVLEAAIFEPGAWQETPERRVPAEIPARDPEGRAQVLATPLGLLLNELRVAPQLVLEPLERLLAMALDMDTGAVGGASARIIFFVLRLAVRVE